MDFRQLMDLRKFLTVEHHVAGRIRLKFALSLLGDERALALKKETEDKQPPACIKSTKVNMLRRSVIIEYDPEVINPKVLHEAFLTEDDARFEELIAELESILSA